MTLWGVCGFHETVQLIVSGDGYASLSCERKLLICVWCLWSLHPGGDTPI